MAVRIGASPDAPFSYVDGMPTLCVLRPVSGGLIGGNTTPSGNTASRLCTVVETRRPYAAPIN